MSTNFTCPECELGTISIVECERPSTIVPGYFVLGVTQPEIRMRACRAAACNSCEFIREVAADGSLLEQ